MHQAFRFFAISGEEHGAWVGDYLFMPDHLHLFVALDERRILLPSWMKSLKNTLSKSMRRQHIPAPHWQKGYFDHVLRSEESYARKWAYVRENPVRAGLARTWIDWPYSGAIFDLEYPRE
jgi:REP element-mobilizing transposase RayT